MLNEQNAEVSATNNPLIYLNKEDEIVFLNYQDLKKFSVKFKGFKEQYQKNEQHRYNSIERMKEEYAQVQEKKLASGLKDELNYLIGSPNKYKQKLMG